jgi:uncharacterized protein YbjT (DUF2867 family)
MIMNDLTPVLLVGATGMLGNRIAHALLDTGRAELRLLARPGSTDDLDKRAALSALEGRGAKIHWGDLDDRVSLVKATRGIEVVVSAVQGGPETIVDGQLELLGAGAGERRAADPALRLRR